MDSLSLKSKVVETPETTRSEQDQISGPLLKTSVQFLDPKHADLMRKVITDATRLFGDNAELIRSTLQSVHDFHRRLAQTAMSAFQPYLQVVQAAEQFGAAVRVALEPVQRIREAFAAIPQEQLSAFQHAFEGLAVELKFPWERVEGPAFRLFAKLGLTGLESHLTRSELLYVLRLSKEKGNKAVREYVFGKFRRDKHRLLNRMVRGWWCLPYMQKRKKAVRAAIGAHKKRQYDLAIPALLPLIDGLAAEIVAATASLKRKAIYTTDVAVMYNAEEAEVWSECVEQVVCALIYKPYDFRTSKKPPSSVNRHGILHGRVIDYGSELNSYRVILLLNVMVKMAERKAKKPLPQ